MAVRKEIENKGEMSLVSSGWKWMVGFPMRVEIKGGLNVWYEICCLTTTTRMIGVLEEEEDVNEGGAIRRE